MRIAVTGAFGYSGRYITKRLLEIGHEVITLTNSMQRVNPFGEKVKAFPFHFEKPEKLRDSLQGVHALVNTYWVRFDHRLVYPRASGCEHQGSVFGCQAGRSAPDSSCEHHQPG